MIRNYLKVNTNFNKIQNKINNYTLLTINFKKKKKKNHPQMIHTMGSFNQTPICKYNQQYIRNDIQGTLGDYQKIILQNK